MSENYRFREVRKGECEAVLAFARANGFAADAKDLHHHLSLALESQGELAAVALCLDDKQGRFQIEIVKAGAELDESLANELADRCLRKVQSASIGAARLVSPAQDPAESILTQANWLDRIEETPPPEVLAEESEDSGQTSQAA